MVIPRATCFLSEIQSSIALGLLLAVLDLNLAQMVLDVWKNMRGTQLFVLNNFWEKSLAQKSSSGGVLALGLPLAVLGPGLDLQMFLNGWKHPKATQPHNLNNFCIKNIAQNQSLVASLL